MPRRSAYLPRLASKRIIAPIVETFSKFCKKLCSNTSFVLEVAAATVLAPEYFFFDFRCSLLSTSGADEDMLRRRSVEVLRIPVFPSDSAPPVNYFDEEYHERMKRFDITPVPRTVSTTFIQPFFI